MNQWKKTIPVLLSAIALGLIVAVFSILSSQGSETKQHGIQNYKYVYHSGKYSRRILAEGDTLDKVEDVDLEYEIIPLSGNNTDLGYYFTYLNLGNPQQRQIVIPDTGSTKLVLPCQDCYKGDCGTHADIHFNWTKSKTASFLKCPSKKFNCDSCVDVEDSHDPGCGYKVFFGEQSTLSGYLVEDQIYFGSYRNATDGFTFLIGCNTEETKMIHSQFADGILGLAPTKKSIIKTAYERNPNIDHNVFSICMAADGGYFNVGGAFSNSPVGIKFFPYTLSRRNHYALPIKEMQLNTETIGDFEATFHKIQPFLDSGTTESYFPSGIYDAFMKKFGNFCQQEGKCLGKKERRCFRPTVDTLDAFFASFPSLTFRLGDVEYEWGSRYYLSGIGSNQHRHCLGISEMKNQETMILGQSFMRNNNWVFDNANQKLGFEPSECVCKGCIIPDPEQNSWLSERTYSREYMKYVIFFLVTVFVCFVAFACYYKYKQKNNPYHSESGGHTHQHVQLTERGLPEQKFDLFVIDDANDDSDIHYEDEEDLEEEKVPEDDSMN